MAYPPYDRKNPASIEAHAKLLMGKSLRQVVPEATLGGGKGTLGLAVEKYWFGISANNEDRPDFPEAGVELKTAPLKRLGRGGFAPKERLVLGMLDFHIMAGETWENSSFLKKNHLLLILFYIHEKTGISLDFLFHRASLWGYSPADLTIMRQDWEKIRAKILDGKAHELSEGDTLYLGACTKGADSSKKRSQPYSPLMAPQRALSLKASYIKSVLGQLEDAESAIKDPSEYAAGGFEEAILRRFRPFLGMRLEQLNKRFGSKLRPSKAYYAYLVRSMLGVHKRRILEFEKAGIVLKVIRLRKNGTPKEDLSFPAFKAREIADQDWPDSDFHEVLEQKFFFVVFREGSNGLILWKTMFWNMPPSDLEEARKVFEETKKRLRAGQTDLPKKSENRVSHVRPHGKNKSDTDTLPNGKKMVKKGFWLNAPYVASVLN